MRKVIALSTIIMLALAPLCFAQPARNTSPATVTHEGRTNFTNIGVNGLDVRGNPGYLALEGHSTHPTHQHQYYLWVREGGTLCISSYDTISTYASFPTGAWDGNMSCTVVGGQS